MANLNCTCKKCKSVLPATKAAYVFPQTGGLCWTCNDAKDIAKARNAMSAKDRKVQEARWNAINATTDAEIRMHCQFGGLPRIGKK